MSGLTTDPMSGERGSEQRRSDGWTAGKVRVGAEARRRKTQRQAQIERVEAGITHCET
jgi:hypothetical protein